MWAEVFSWWATVFSSDPSDPLLPALSLTTSPAFLLCALTLSSLHTPLSSLIFVHAFCSLPPFPVFRLFCLRSTSSKEPSVICQDWVTCPSSVPGRHTTGSCPCTWHSCSHLTVAFTPSDCLVAHVGHFSWHITGMYLPSSVPGTQ